MAFTDKISYIIYISVMHLAASHLTAANTADVQQFGRGMERFGTDLFVKLAEKHPDENIVFSPFCVQTGLAMVRLGAEGKAALELDRGLGLSAQKTEDLANHYHAILAQYKNSPIVKIANKLYVMAGYKVRDTFNELLTNQFHSSVDSLNFANSVTAAQTINTWVEEKTNKLIKNLIDPSSLDATTRLVLVNAIYFKGTWQNQFREELTREADFYLDATRTTKVQMMHGEGSFRYADLPDLDATALEMPYKAFELSMMFILPNKRTGLNELQRKLKNTSLTDIIEQMIFSQVIVDVPKFKAEFQAELSEPLSEMGMKRMFSPKAELGKMLESEGGLHISSVIHKAFIEVNERGTEAAAATGTLIRKKRALIDSTETKEFNVEHPFLFKILHRAVSAPSTPATGLIWFAGKIKNIDQNVSQNNQIKDEL